jgi:hypothetical protein
MRTVSLGTAAMASRRRRRRPEAAPLLALPNTHVRNKQQLALVRARALITIIILCVSLFFLDVYKA